jgi:hypothetical protein
MPKWIEEAIKKGLIKKSDRKNKKLVGIAPSGNEVHFGHPDYEHYYDETGIWENLNHLDEERRDNYNARAKKIKDKRGKLTYMNPESPNAWAYWVLWNPNRKGNKKKGEGLNWTSKFKFYL